MIREKFSSLAGESNDNARAQCLLKLHEHHHTSRTIKGRAALVQRLRHNASPPWRLCRDEDLSPERTVFVSGIGCLSRDAAMTRTIPRHPRTGVPVAEGTKMARPDLAGSSIRATATAAASAREHLIRDPLQHEHDGDPHDNHVHGPIEAGVATSPLGFKATRPARFLSRTLNPLTVTLAERLACGTGRGLGSGSALTSSAPRITTAGFSFVHHPARPEFPPKMFESWLDPQKTLLRRTPTGSR